jgi:hypothetical protein
MFGRNKNKVDKKEEKKAKKGKIHGDPEVELTY